MNYCIFSGYLENKFAFKRNDDGEYHFDFFVSVENDDGIARPIPFRAYGNMALKIYNQLQVGYYVELTCKYYRINNSISYFVVKDLMYRAPKAENQYYIKSSELLEIFNPKNVLETLKKESKDEDNL